MIPPRINLRDQHDGGSSAQHSDAPLEASAKQWPEHSNMHAEGTSSQEQVINPWASDLKCSNCESSETTIWRRSSNGSILCNACGIYYRTKKKMRPVITPENEKTAPSRGVLPEFDESGSCMGNGQCNGTGGHKSCQGCVVYFNRFAGRLLPDSSSGHRTNGQIAKEDSYSSNASSVVNEKCCSNCGTSVTPIWRRGRAGQFVCNACGIYCKFHGYDRPISMKRAYIRRRQRFGAPPINRSVDHISKATVEKDPLEASAGSRVPPPTRVGEELVQGRKADTSVPEHPRRQYDSVTALTQRPQIPRIEFYLASFQQESDKTLQCLGRKDNTTKCSDLTW